MFSVIQKNGFTNQRLESSNKQIFASKRRRMMWPGYLLVSVLSLLLLANVEQSIRMAEQEILSFKNTALQVISSNGVQDLVLPKQKTTSLNNDS